MGGGRPRRGLSAIAATALVAAGPVMGAGPLLAQDAPAIRPGVAAPASDRPTPRDAAAANTAGGAGISLDPATMPAADAAAPPIQPGVTQPLAGPAPSADTQAPPAQAVTPSPAPSAADSLRQAVLTVDQEAMYRQSRWGQRAQADLAARSLQVANDNDTAFAALVADEDALTAARPTLAPEEFRRRAAAFDERVTAVRQEREAARTALQAAAERDRALFFQAAAPVMGRVMAAHSALVVLDQHTVLISDQRIDATAEIIAALDAELGDGSAIVAADAAAPADPPTPPATGADDGSDATTGGPTPATAPDLPPESGASSDPDAPAAEPAR